MRVRNIIIGGAILSVILGFGLGKVVVADSPKAGSSADPVVSKSYVDKAVQDRITELEAQVAALTVQANALQNTINDLQNKLSSASSKTPTAPSTVTTSPSTVTNPPSTGSTTPTTDSSLIGKTAAVQGTSKINLRSGAGTSFTAIGSVGPGETMTIQQVKTGDDGKPWYQVKIGTDKTGWVAGWLVTVK